jgi:hypothetical protein
VPFYASLRSYSRRFLVFTVLSRLEPIDARTMPSRFSKKCENLKYAVKREKIEDDQKNAKNNGAAKNEKNEPSRGQPTKEFPFLSELPDLFE